MQVVSRVRNRLGFELALTRLFQEPTIAALAHELSGSLSKATDWPLVPQDRPPRIPLSFAQQRLWFLDQLEPNNPFYNIPMAFRVHGMLSDEALKEALCHLMRRHEVLRTSFHHDEHGAYQCVHDDLSLTMTQVDCTKKDDKTVRALLSEEALKPFDLSQAPLWRVCVFTCAHQESVVLLVFHHSIGDGWSIPVVLRELSALYAAVVNKTSVPLAPLPIQYADFALWQRQLLREDGALYQAQLAYWQETLSGAPVLLNLPLDYPRPAFQDYKGAQVEVSLPSGLERALQAISDTYGVTPYMVFLAAFVALLHRYTHQDDVVIGSPIANRHYQELEGLIGFFVNTVALRVRLEDNESFAALLATVKTQVVAAQQHQDLPFERLVESLNIERSLAHSPLFQVCFTFNPKEEDNLALMALEVSPEALDYPVAKFDLTLSIQKKGSKWIGIVSYATSLFKPETIERLATHYGRLLEGLLKEPEWPVGAHDFLSAEERQRLLIDWNKTERAYPQDKTVHGLFEEQVGRTPDNVAVVYEEEQLTYRELNAKANQLAHYLREQGVGPEVLVAIACERSLEMVIGILGILKAGGAYVPLDPSYPKERLEFMLKDTQAPLLLTQKALRKTLPKTKAKVVCLDEWSMAVSNYPTTNPIPAASANNLAYVIYTSGSTGQPKGVLSIHQGCVNRLLWMQNYCNMSSSDRILQKTPYTFDVSVWEFFLPLIGGAEIVFAKPDGHKDPLYLAEVIKQYEITILHFVPSMLQGFLDSLESCECPTVHSVITSGEALTASLVSQFKQKLSKTKLYNLYGPTEASIDVTYYDCSEKTTVLVPIGKPIWNIKLYILDS
ncbi:TPA: condensation domain-containing protein, partial [Legionella pneumophila]